MLVLAVLASLGLPSFNAPVGAAPSEEAGTDGPVAISQSLASIDSNDGPGGHFGFSSLLNQVATTQVVKVITAVGGAATGATTATASPGQLVGFRIDVTVPAPPAGPAAGQVVVFDFLSPSLLEESADNCTTVPIGTAGPLPAGVGTNFTALQCFVTFTGGAPGTPATASFGIIARVAPTVAAGQIDTNTACPTGPDNVTIAGACSTVSVVKQLTPTPATPTPTPGTPTPTLTPTLTPTPIPTLTPTLTPTPTATPVQVVVIPNLPPPPLQFIPPPPPPLLPPPMAAVCCPQPACPPRCPQPQAVFPEVPVIPEADSLFLLVGGLAALGGLVGFRHLRRRRDDDSA